jgi:hypothetical protein
MKKAGFIFGIIMGTIGTSMLFTNEKFNKVAQKLRQ